MTNTHAGRLLSPTARAEEFELLARLVGEVPVCEVAQGRNLASLPQLCDSILGHLELNRLGRPTVLPADG